MPFEKGRSKTGGRKRGSVNKKTQDLMAKCEAAGIDPFSSLLELCNSDDQGLRLSALKEVLPYLYPKRKALEIEADHRIAGDEEQAKELADQITAMMNEAKQ